MKDNTISSRASSVPVTTRAPQTTRVVSEQAKKILYLALGILVTCAAAWAIYTVVSNAETLSLTHKVIILAAGVGPLLLGIIAALVNDYCKKRVTHEIPNKPKPIHTPRKPNDIPNPPQNREKTLLELVTEEKFKVDASQNYKKWELLYQVERSLQDTDRDPSLLIDSYVNSSETIIQDALNALRAMVNSPNSTDQAITAQIRSVTKEHLKRKPGILNDPNYNHFFKALYGADLNSFRKEQLNSFVEDFYHYRLNEEDFVKHCEYDFGTLTKDQIKKIYEKLRGKYSPIPLSTFLSVLCYSTAWSAQIRTLMVNNLCVLDIPVTSITAGLLSTFPNVLDQYQDALKKIDDCNTLLSYEAPILSYAIRKRLLSPAVKTALKSHLQTRNIWKDQDVSPTFTQLIMPLAQTTINAQRTLINAELAAWDASRNQLLQAALAPLEQQDKKQLEEITRRTQARDANLGRERDAKHTISKTIPSAQAALRDRVAQLKTDLELFANEQQRAKAVSEELQKLDGERIQVEAELKQRERRRSQEAERKQKESDEIPGPDPIAKVREFAQNMTAQRQNLSNQIAVVDKSLAGRLETIEKELTALLARLEHSRTLVRNEKDKFTTQNNEMLELDAFIDKYSNAPNINEYVEKRRKLVAAQGDELARNKKFFQGEDAQQETLIRQIQQLEKEKEELERTLALVAFGGSKDALLARNPKKVKPVKQPVPPPSAGNAANGAGDPSRPPRMTAEDLDRLEVVQTMMSAPLTAEERQEMEQQKVARYNPAAGLLSTTVHSQNLGTRLAALNLPFQTLLSSEADKKALEARKSNLDAPPVTFDEVPQSIVDDVQAEEEDGTLELQMQLERIQERMEQLRGIGIPQNTDADFKRRAEAFAKEGIDIELRTKEIEAQRFAAEIALKQADALNQPFAAQVEAATKEREATQKQINELRTNFWPATHTKAMRDELEAKLHREATGAVIQTIYE